MAAGIELCGTFTGHIASWFLGPGEQVQDDELKRICKELVQIKAMLARGS